MLVVHVARCDFNVYDKVYTLEVDVHNLGAFSAVTHIITIPEASASTEADMKASVELFLRQRERRIHDWSGYSWNAVV